MIRKKYCVDGAWLESKTEKWMPVTDSSTGAVIAEVPSCTQDEVLAAIDAADRAFSTGHRCPCPSERSCCSIGEMC